MPRDTSGEWKERFDKQFGKFYIQAFSKSRELYYSKSGGSSDALCDFEAGEDDIFTASESIKDFIKQELASQKELWLGRAIEKVNDLKKPLWNDDIKKHTENINRHNALDEAIAALSSLSEGE